MKESFKHINHEILRYANCWEDAEILLAGLDIEKGDRVLSIGSGGDNSLILLAKSPALVTAIDINTTQLYTIELKQCAIRALNHQEFIAFIGFEQSDSTTRRNTYNQLKGDLSDKAQQYWDSHQDMILNGLIYQGKFEKYFLMFSRFVLPLIHGKKRIKVLMAPKSEVAQSEFYKNKWNTWRWRLLFKIFFGKTVMAKFGRDKALFNEVEGSVKDLIFNKAEAELSSVNCQTNYFLRFILTGRFGKTLPLYARPENFDQIKANIDRLELKIGLLEDSLTEIGNYNKFNLSNIFEYMTDQAFNEIANKLGKQAQNDAKFVYWNLMVSRDLTQTSAILRADIPRTLIDKTFFYKQYFYNAI